MGRRKFRLSDMIPNAWFYKLRDMRARGRRGGGMQSSSLSSSSSSRGSRAAQHQQEGTPRLGASSSLPRRASYYFTTRDRDLLPPLSPPPSPPRSCRRRQKVGLAFGGALAPAPPVSGGCQCVTVGEAHDATKLLRRDMFMDNCDGRGGGSSRWTTVAVSEEVDGFDHKVAAFDDDIIIDLAVAETPERVLRPIVTKPAARRELERRESEVKHVDLGETAPSASSASEQSNMGKPRRSSSSSGRRLKTRTNSPRLAVRNGKPAAPATAARKKTTRSKPLGDSYAVVKLSSDPRTDFLESMEEMIAKNGIRDADDLENLLACYLSLNDEDHHDLIVDVFEQVWKSLADVKPGQIRRHDKHRIAHHHHAR